jgi:hypothetical protein
MRRSRRRTLCKLVQVWQALKLAYQSALILVVTVKKTIIILKLRKCV